MTEKGFVVCIVPHAVTYGRGDMDNDLVPIRELMNMFSNLVYPGEFKTPMDAEYQQYLLYVSYINICHLGIASGMFLNYAGKKMEEIQKGRYKSEICFAKPCLDSILSFPCR